MPKTCANPILKPDPVLDLRAELMRRGYSIKSFAEAHGYSRMTVRYAIDRHIGGKCRTVRGRITERILADIQAIIGNGNGETDDASGR